MVECKAYENLRKELFQEIEIVSRGKWCMEGLSPESQFLLLMGGSRDRYQDNLQNRIFSFVRQAFKCRKYLCKL